MSNKSEYANFEELRRAQRLGVNYRIHIWPRNSRVAVIAPHAGRIEPNTDRIAIAIGGTDFSIYNFAGLKSADPNKTLHITSSSFDEPKCLALIAKCDVVVAVHGLAANEAYVHVGGRDQGLRDSVCAHLSEADFVAQTVASGDHAGVSERNICNRGGSKMGVQLEISKALRDQLNGDKLAQFAQAVRSAITKKY